jgi:zinc protease
MLRAFSGRVWMFVLLLTPVLSIAPTGTISQAADPAKKAGDDPVAQAAAALYEGIRTETLPNGLRVYMKPVPGSAIVTTMVAYKVGSADEELTQTGLSHYLEHLMFKGTDKLMPGDIDRITQRNGGMNNAYTSEDYTIFHFDFAADNWEVPLKIEADRMRNLRIDDKHEFEQEKGAVCAELDRDEDDPWDLENKMIVPLLFGPKAPYGHPVIGEREHVHAATAKIIKAHYDKWYHPNNAALVVAGGFDADKVFAKIKDLFGPIPRTKLPERKEGLPIVRKGPVREKMASKFEVPRLLMGYNTVKSGEPDSYPLAVLQFILGGGKTSRLYKKFVEGEAIASTADASSSTGRYPGWFSLQIELLKGKDLQKAEDLLLTELKRLREQPVSDAELKRVKQSLVAGAIFGREKVHDLADSIARGVTTNDLDYLKTYLPRINAVTAEDVQRVAKKYLDPEQRVVVWSVPGKGEKGDGQKDRPGDRNARAEPSLEFDVELQKQLMDLEGQIREDCAAIEALAGLAAKSNDAAERLKFRTESQKWQADLDASKAKRAELITRTGANPELPGYFRRRPPAVGEKGGSAGQFSLKDAKRVVLPNGLTLLMYENRRLPIVVAQAIVKDVFVHEPADKAGLASLVGRLLDEGSARHSGPEIAEIIENVGGTLTMVGSGASVKVLTPHRKIGLGLMFECLSEAAFPEDAFERQRDQLLSEIDDLEQRPDARARNMYRSLLYGKHPYGRPPSGTRKTAEALTPKDCLAFHRKLFVPNNTIVAVAGDFDSKQLVEEITALTAGWKKGDVVKPKLPPPAFPEKFTEKFVTISGAAQLYFYMGHPGIRRDNPDYYKLLVMDNVLGTGPGFTDRLSAKIRDRAGLAYTVSATITGDTGEEPGLFTCFVGTEPKHLTRVKNLFLEELNNIREEPPTETEVEDAKKYLLGSLPFRFTGNEDIAGQLLTTERYGLGLGYLDDYRKAVAAVTPADIQAMAKKYLDPQRMVLVAAGAVDAKGKPLSTLPAPKEK